MAKPTLSPDLINAAIDGYELQKTRIDAQIAELRSMLPGGVTAVTAADAGSATRKRFSAAARRKMAQAQKARWAKVRGESEGSAKAPAKKTAAKRRISPEGMARIIAATKKRWAAHRAAKAKGESK